RGHLELRKERIELADVVRGAVETSRPAIDALGHELTVALPEHPLYLDGDLVRLGQAFSNLLYNSAKYTEPGGRIRLEAQPQGAEVAVAVRDNGIGIAADALPRIFDMFRQGEGALARSQGGLGIGLTLVRRFVEMHGGSVEAHSDGPARGSEFVVRLPLAEPQACAAETGPPAESRTDDAPPPKTPRRVLVVDDNKDSAATLSMMLEVIGGEVRMAHDGLEAIEAAAAFLPEIIFMDLGMPKLDGYQATRRIRTMPWGKEIVIVALTGWGQSDDVRQSSEAGCTTHVVKPIDFAVLRKLMSEQDACGAAR
ncbi:MAG TPA: ATP-binding protein, partial [Thermomicrobiales bacterium]|nr:ATP-binding protein [Thermomicrobiales bacterium]